MAGLNKVTLIGNLTKDPEIKTFDSGDRVANFSIATDESYKDKNGDKVKKAEFHNIVVYGGVVKVIENYVSKGSKLYVEGKIKTRKWENKEGQTVSTTEVVVSGFNSSIILLDSKSMDKQNNQTESIHEDLDDEIPF